MNEDIRFDEEKVTNAIDMLKDAQKDFQTADQTFYEAVMAIGYSQGIDLLLNTNEHLNLYMPEKMIVECRDAYKSVSEEIENAVNTIKALNSDKLSSNPNESSEQVSFKANEATEEVTQNTTSETEVQARESTDQIISTPHTDEELIKQNLLSPNAQEVESLETMELEQSQLIYGPPPAGEGVRIPGGGYANNQLVYGPPTATNPTPITVTGIQDLYGPPQITGPTQTTVTGTQLVYGPPQTTNPTQVVVTGTQLLYGPPPTTNPTQTTVTGTQLVYGPPPTTNPTQVVVTGTQVVVTGTQVLYGPPPSSGITEIVVTGTQLVYGPPQDLTDNTQITEPTIITNNPTDDATIPTNNDNYMPQGDYSAYENVPQTGIEGKSNISKLFGGIAAAAGFAGAATILSKNKDEDEEEE